MMRSANIYVNKVHAGVLTENRDNSFSFRYADGYFNDPSQTSISLTLPKSIQEHHSEFMFPFFSNMLAEGMNKRMLCRNLKIDEDDDFGLLLATASNDTIGAVTIKQIRS